MVFKAAILVVPFQFDGGMVDAQRLKFGAHFAFDGECFHVPYFGNNDVYGVYDETAIQRPCVLIVQIGHMWYGEQGFPDRVLIDTRGDLLHQYPCALAQRPDRIEEDEQADGDAQ